MPAPTPSTVRSLRGFRTFLVLTPMHATLRRAIPDDAARHRAAERGRNGTTVGAEGDSTLPLLPPPLPFPVLHGDHLGSVALATGATGLRVSNQDFDPWGKVRPGNTISQTTLNYTGQRLDGSGLLYYHARYYDPTLARFLSADSVVPGSASGGMDGVALKPLTVDIHEQGKRQKVKRAGFRHRCAVKPLIDK